MLNYKEKSHTPTRIIPREWLEEIYEHVLSSLKRNTSKKEFYKTGSIKLFETTSEMKVKLQFYYFACDIEDILSNIDFIVSDLNILKTMPNYFKDSPHRRFYLLLRMFYYEFYRIKEKLKNFLSMVENEKYIGKDRIENINKLFHTIFMDTLSLRNKLVHHNVIWTEGHIELELLSQCEELGFRLKRVDTEEEVEWDTLLPELVANYSKAFQEQCDILAEFIETLIEELSKLVILKQSA